MAVEFFLGDSADADGVSEAQQQMAVMRAHTEHAEVLRELASVSTRTLSVISQAPAAVDLASVFVDPRGLVLCDPELSIAEAFGLSCVEGPGDARRYRRPTLLARDARRATCEHDRAE